MYRSRLYLLVQLYVILPIAPTLYERFVNTTLLKNQIRSRTDSQKCSNQLLYWLSKTKPFGNFDEPHYSHLQSIRLKILMMVVGFR